jgi:hypothetical protein
MRYFVIPDAPRFKQFTYSRLQIATKSHLKRKVKGNFIKVVDDSKSKRLDKAKIKEQLIKAGALFVTFAKKQMIKNSQVRVDIKKTTNKKEIVTSFAKKLAQQHKLDERRTEQIGVKILYKAESKDLI